MRNILSSHSILYMKQGQQVCLAFDPEHTQGSVSAIGPNGEVRVTFRAQTGEKNQKFPRLRAWYDKETAAKVLR